MGEISRSLRGVKTGQGHEFYYIFKQARQAYRLEVSRAAATMRSPPPRVAQVGTSPKAP